MPRKTRWKHLIETDDDFRRWYQNLSRGSVNTAKLNARTLYRFCSITGMVPAQVVERAKDDRRGFEDVLLDLVTRLREEGKAPSYIENYITCVKSWLQFNDVTLVRKIKIGNTNHTPTIENERVPMKEELRQILNYTGERGRCSISLMAFSGLRPQVLGNGTGTNGLEIRDLPELEINGKEANFSTIPAMVVVRPELSKAKHKYFTFLGPEGCEYLKAYLEKRLASGEMLDQDSAIITCKEGYQETGYRAAQRDNQHITVKTLTKEIRDALRPKYRWRPYGLRAYFDTQLLVAENNGKIAHAYRQFFMGHKGDIEARYTTNKGRLPENVIEDMREAYRKSLEYLETGKQGVSEDKLRDALRRQLLLVAGFSGEEIDDLDLSMDDTEFQETVRKKLLGSMVNNGNNQRVVSLDDVEEYLSRGWNFVARLNDEKAILRLP
ncbi:MAG: site-specific integrase [Candidatus Bathyarchaeota archaeon]